MNMSESKKQRMRSTMYICTTIVGILYCSTSLRPPFDPDSFPDTTSIPKPRTRTQNGANVKTICFVFNENHRAYIVLQFPLFPSLLPLPAPGHQVPQRAQFRVRRPDETYQITRRHRPATRVFVVVNKRPKTPVREAVVGADLHQRFDGEAADFGAFVALRVGEEGGEFLGRVEAIHDRRAA